jgi:hypothetical protein
MLKYPYLLVFWKVELVPEHSVDYHETGTLREESHEKDEEMDPSVNSILLEVRDSVCHLVAKSHSEERSNS